MKRAGIGPLALACLSACDGLQEPIVFRGQTHSKYEAFCGCIEQAGAFGALSLLSPDGKGAGPETYSYGSSAGPMFVFIGIDRQPLTVLIRSRDDLTEPELAALRKCL